MSPAMGKSGEKIRKIVRFRQMLRRWRRKARVAAGISEPLGVPAGHVAVIVGGGCRRFAVRASHLNHPVFRRLLVQAEEEFGFVNEGPLTIPCHEAVFEEILRVMDSAHPARFLSLEDFQRCCHVGIRADAESRPLLRGLADDSVF